MTTTVPAVYAFPEFSGVAAAVADHVIAAQNAALSGGSKPNASGKLSSSSINSHHNHSTNVSHSRNGNGSNSGNNSSSSISSTSSRRFKIGLSGGSLIAVLNEGLLARTDVLWDKWDIYFADERLVPFDDPESNYGLVKRHLLDLIGEDKPRPRVFHVDESLLEDAQEAADAYEKTLIRGFAAKDSVKLPMFDLLLLGCAPDGHTCSLFPHHSLLRENLAWVAPIEDAPKAPARRITLTLPVICHSHRVTFVVEGQVKAPIIKTIMERPEKGSPCSLVNEGAAGKVSWFVDNEALTGVFVTKKEYKMLVKQ